MKKLLLLFLIPILVSCGFTKKIDLGKEYNYFEYKASNETIDKFKNEYNELYPGNVWYKKNNDDGYEGENHLYRIQKEFKLNNLLFYKGEPFTGIIYENYPEGNPFIDDYLDKKGDRTYYSQEFKEGKKEGFFNSYIIKYNYPLQIEEAKWRRILFKDNFIAGWDENFIDGMFSVNDLKSLSKEYLENRKLTISKRDSLINSIEIGLENNPFNEGNFLLIKRNYILPDRDFIEYQYDEIPPDEILTETIISQESYYLNGQLEKKTTYADKKTGYSLYMDNGGVNEEYYDNGQLKNKTYVYSGDYGPGTREAYYRNGQLKMRYTKVNFLEKKNEYSNDSINRAYIDGLFEHYLEDGTKVFKINMKKNNYYVDGYGNFSYYGLVDYNYSKWYLDYDSGGSDQIRENQLQSMYNLFNNTKIVKEKKVSEPEKSGNQNNDLIKNYLKETDNKDINGIMSFWSNKPIRYWNINNKYNEKFITLNQIKKSISKALTLNSNVENIINNIKKIDDNKYEVSVLFKYTSKKTSITKHLDTKTIIIFDEDGKIIQEYSGGKAKVIYDSSK